MTLALPRATDPTQARHNQALVAEDLRNRKIGSDVELGAERLILRSPNGTRIQVVASDLGVVSAVAATSSGQATPPSDAWTNYTPVLDASAGAITSYTNNSARFMQTGKTVRFEVDVSITNAGTASSAIRITLPVTGAPYRQAVPGFEGVSLKSVYGVIALATSYQKAVVRFYDGTFPGATGNQLVLSGTYEAA